MVEYVIWNYEVVSSSLASYTKWSVSLKAGCQAFYLMIPVRIRYRLPTFETVVCSTISIGTPLHWFVSVMVT